MLKKYIMEQYVITVKISHLYSILEYLVSYRSGATYIILTFHLFSPFHPWTLYCINFCCFTIVICNILYWVHILAFTFILTFVYIQMAYFFLMFAYLFILICAVTDKLVIMRSFVFSHQIKLSCVDIFIKTRIVACMFTDVHSDMII